MTLLPPAWRRLFHSLPFAAVASAGLLSSDALGEDFQLPDEIRFNRDVRTIFSKTCFACHGPDANAREAKLRLDVRDEAIKVRSDGERPIVPGDAEKSLPFS